VRRRLGYSWGETTAVREANYPCDALVADPHQEAWRALDIDAPAALVWRWLCQLRVAPYSYDWVDNRGRRSPQELTPGSDELELGQRALVYFEIAAFERDRSLTLHVPDSPFGELAVGYSVTPVADDRTRLHAKVIVRYPKRVKVMHRVPPLGDLIMMRKQLRTFKRLAERDHWRTQGEPPV
jgi:hypothetical protein